MNLRIALAGAACLVALAAGCGSCADRGKMDAGEPDGELDGDISDSEEEEVDYDPLMMRAHGSTDGPPSQSRPFARPDIDIYNHYNSTVLLGPGGAEPDDPGEWHCSGVVVASNLVLTAAHCVCTPTRGQTLRFDGSVCAAKTKVRIRAAEHEGERRATVFDLAGNISIHPQFELVLDSQGAIVTSRADLAVIRLEKPQWPDIHTPPPARLATEDVEGGEMLVIVGFPTNENGHLISLVRSFSHETVGSPAGDDTYFFGSEKDASNKGDMGGPCLRETERGRELVGISQRGLGLRSTLTRVVPYRKWLEEQIRLASEKH